MGTAGAVGAQQQSSLPTIPPCLMVLALLAFVAPPTQASIRLLCDMQQNDV